MNNRLIIKEHPNGQISFYLSGEFVGIVGSNNPEQLAPIMLSVFEAGKDAGYEEARTDLKGWLDGE